MNANLNKTLEIEKQIPASIIKKWDSLIDILRETFNLKAGQIHIINGKEHKILSESYSDINTSTQIQEDIYRYSHYHLELNQKHNLNKTDNKFEYPLETVLNQSNDETYYEYPLYHLNGELFGTLSILHNNSNGFSEEITHLIKHTINTIELDLSIHMIDQDYKTRIKKQFQDELDFIKDNKKATIDSISLYSDKKQVYQFIFDETEAAVIIFEPIFNSTNKLIDARYIDLNPSCEEIIGYKKSEVLGKSILDVFPETEQTWFDSLEHVVKEKTRIKFEQYHKPMGKHFSVDAFLINDNSICVFFFDISIQKRLKDEIESSYKRNKSFFDSLTSAIVIFEPIFTNDKILTDLRYVDMNSINEDIIKEKKEKIIGKLLSEVFPEIHHQILDYFQLTCSKNKKNTPPPYFLLDSKYYILNTFSIENNLLAFIADDRTEEVLSKKETEESEGKYKSIFQDSTTVMMLIDPETGQIVDVNQAAEDYSGYKKEQLKTMNICQINKLDINVVLEKIRLSQSGSQTYFELKHHTADGKILDVEIYTSKLLDKGKSLLITTVHDITNKKIAEKENIKLSQVVHQSPISIVITDPNGLIEYSNPNNCKITGYKLEELIGQNPRIFKSGKFPDEKYAQLWQTIKAGGIWSGELYNKKKDGSYYWEYARITSIIDQQGRTTNYVKIGEDITSRKKLENKLQRISIKAEESERLKTSFLANMSHEIRTPLNGILGFTNLMMDDDISTEIREKYGNTIKESSEQLMMIVNDLVRISQLEAGTLNIKYSKFNINQLVNETVNLFEEECRNKNITTKLTTNFCDNYSFVSDKKRIRQVLDNLVKNAIKFTDKGQILIGVMCKKNHLQFSVEDTGIGIKPADQKIIFDRFRQLEDHYARHFGGNGLGLSISKEIIELLGGEIWVESEYGKGAKFQFTIPLEQDIEISKTLKKN